VNAQEVYIKRCATCHGSEGNLEMGGAKKIVNSTLSKQEIKNQILYGKGKMPPFQEVLTGAEVDALTDYAFTLSGR
jgi:mono/diheme cytochrome c family protein